MVTVGAVRGGVLVGKGSRWAPTSRQLVELWLRRVRLEAALMGPLPTPWARYRHSVGRGELDGDLRITLHTSDRAAALALSHFHAG